MDKNLTYIQVKVKTREQLKKLGAKGQSYDTLVKELMEFREKHEHE